MEDYQKICDVIERLKEIEKVISEKSIVSVPIDVWGGMVKTIEETLGFLEVQKKYLFMIMQNEENDPCKNCQEFSCDFCKEKDKMF